MKNKRLIYATIFCVLMIMEICIALFVQDAFVRPYVGDMLVTLLLCCMARVVFPEKTRLLPLFVFLVATCVEVGQYFDLVALLGFEDNRFISIALGSTFSLLDIVCYAAGCVAAFGLDRIMDDQKKEVS